MGRPRTMRPARITRRRPGCTTRTIRQPPLTTTDPAAATVADGLPVAPPPRARCSAWPPARLWPRPTPPRRRRAPTARGSLRAPPVPPRRRRAPTTRESLLAAPIPPEPTRRALPQAALPLQLRTTPVPRLATRPARYTRWAGFIRRCRLDASHPTSRERRTTSVATRGFSRRTARTVSFIAWYQLLETTGLLCMGDSVRPCRSRNASSMSPG